MDTTDYTPRPKVAAAGIGGAITLVVVYLLGLVHVDVPAEVASALTVIVAFASGYIKKDNS